MWWKDDGKTIVNVDIWRSGIVPATITFVFTIVSRPEFLLLKVKCLISFGKAVIQRSHEIFKPVSKSGYPDIWRVDSFKKFGKFSEIFCPGCVLCR